MDSPLHVLIGAFGAALLLTPFASLVATRRGWVDRPGPRKVHDRATPLFGGAAVIGSFAVVLALAFWPSGTAEPAVELDRRLLAIVAGGALMFAVGLRDDLCQLGAVSKLIAQLAAASVVALSGVSISGISLGPGVELELGIFGFPLTVLWIVWATNALNIIDGLDSLACGLALIGAGVVSWAAWSGGNESASLMMLALMGAVGGFGPYNAHPARIFLGDAGSLFIGFILAATSALVASEATTLAGFTVPVLALGIPVLDLSFAAFRRLLEGRSIMSADRNHIHHRLSGLGYGQRKTVVLLCGVALLSVAPVVLLQGGPLQEGLAFAGSLFLLVWLFSKAGAIRLTESFAAFCQVASSARAVSDEKHAVDELTLAFRDVRSVEQWWAVVVKTADVLGFTGLSMELPSRSGGVRSLSWSRDQGDGAERRCCEATRLTIPVGDRRGPSHLRLQVVVEHEADSRTLGRRIALFHPFLSANGLDRIDVE